ncbi:FAD-binding oxidoreductase, partial [Pseudooctadecabacter jejudonensis]
VRQTFGNCPKYIHERAWRRVPNPVDVDARISDALSDAQILRIKAADTMFIGSGHRGHPGAPSSGYDASHRGGAPGFVRVVSATHLQIPDYPGNNFFNTIGNLMSDPRVGLLFVDFETGGLLHITGRADIDWTPGNSHGPNAARVITVEIDQIIERPGAVSLRWSTQDHLKQSLRVIKREQESATITSFSLAAPDGRPLDAFKAGQHLPIEVDIPGQAGPLNRSYSLSGSPNDLSHYRVSIKREDKGLVSRFFHDKVHIGSTIKASPPTGDFTIPCSTCPLFLISAGVGMTPMVAAMLANATETNREVWYIHGARNGSTHAFQSEVDALVAQNPQLHKYICYSQPESTDVEGRDYDARGHVTAQKVISLNPSPNAHFMLCGPADFLAEMRGGLEMAGVPEGKIHLETFGTKQVIRLGERHDFQTLT